MKLVDILLICFWIATMALAFWHREAYNWLIYHLQKKKVKKIIHKVLAEPEADSKALAFALAVSDVQSEDLYAASDVHPAIKDRFEKEQKEKIAEQAFLLRKDEHEWFLYNRDNFGTKLHDALQKEHRKSYEEQRSPRPPNPLIRQLRESLGEMADRMEQEKRETQKKKKREKRR